MNKILKTLTLLGLATLLTLPPTQAAKLTAKQTTNWHIIIRIDDIHCVETEDLLGSDEFYPLGIFTFGLPDGRQLVRTRTTGVMSINNGNHKKGTTILDCIVPSGTTSSGELMVIGGISTLDQNHPQLQQTQSLKEYHHANTHMCP